jgi:hypothetical protein
VWHLPWWVTPLGFRVTFASVNTTCILIASLVMWLPFILILNIHPNTRATLKEATLPFTPLLCCMSYCFVVCPTVLSRVLLLCCISYYFIIVFTTPPWVPLLRRGLHYSAVCSTYLTAYKLAWFMSISC